MGSKRGRTELVATWERLWRLQDPILIGSGGRPWPRQETLLPPGRSAGHPTVNPPPQQPPTQPTPLPGRGGRVAGGGGQASVATALIAQ